jgi:formylglycine-generating enzyme required for sulfatase activity
VGSFNPNAWGLYGMHGNVWEWCWDLYGLYFEARVKPVPLTNPTGSDDGAHRINRGGGWESPGKNLRYLRLPP